MTLEELYRQFGDRVYTWARRYNRRDAAWAEDLTHDVFLQAMPHVNRLREEDAGAWLYRVTQNLAFSQLKRQRSVLGRFQSMLRSSWHVESPRTPEETLASQELASSATAALQRLPGQERLVVSMKVLDGLSQREIAETLSLSEGYVSKLWSRARSRLMAEGWEVGDDA